MVRCPERPEAVATCVKERVISWDADSEAKAQTILD